MTIALAAILVVAIGAHNRDARLAASDTYDYAQTEQITSDILNELSEVVVEIPAEDIAD
ncbi:MAG: hypothetical protein HUJ69_02225 [Lachnospiraceae bacterium]|nr:hypothetical protein [Lachnospiraceae bacterium]